VNATVGGTVTLIGYYATYPPGSGETVVVYRDVPYTQEINLVENDPQYAEVLEEGYDRAVILIQQLKDLLSRAPLLPITAGFANLALPEPDASKYLCWNAAGTALQNVGLLSADLPVDGDLATFLETPSSANLAAALTDETGSGALVFANSPTITTPTISGHPVIEGVTPTGATGTGKLVFDTSPTLVTPTLGEASGTGLTLSGLSASLPVFTDGSKKLVSGALLSTWFLQELTNAVSNVTGDGTDYPLTGVTWTNYGQSPSGCFSSGTFTTSGSAGKYIFYGTIQLTGIGAGHTSASIRLSSGTYLCSFNPAALAVSGVVTISIISMESLNPSFPVYIRVMVGGSTKTVGIGAVAVTRFGGLKIL
jgi:hypothetical protein